MRRTFATVATLAALGLGQAAALYAAASAQSYGGDNTQNAGWVMNLPAGHWCGVETRGPNVDRVVVALPLGQAWEVDVLGAPGLFCDVS